MFLFLKSEKMNESLFRSTSFFSSLFYTSTATIPTNTSDHRFWDRRNAHRDAEQIVDQTLVREWSDEQGCQVHAAIEQNEVTDWAFRPIFVRLKCRLLFLDRLQNVVGTLSDCVNFVDAATDLLEKCDGLQNGGKHGPVLLYIQATMCDT